MQNRGWGWAFLWEKRTYEHKGRWYGWRCRMRAYCMEKEILTIPWKYSRKVQAVGTGTCTPVQLFSHTSTCTGYSCRLASTIQPAEPTTQAADLKSWGLYLAFFLAWLQNPWKQYATLLRLSSQIAQNVINSQLLGACELLTMTKYLFFTYKILQNNPKTGTETQFRGLLAGECGRGVGGLQNSSKSLLIWVGRNFRNLHPISVDKKSMRSWRGRASI